MLLGEIYLDRLYKLPLRKPVAREISRFQPVRRDFSLILDAERSVGAASIKRIAALQIPELVEWRAREVFRDAKLGAGEYSLLLGSRSRRPIALCAKKNCRRFNRESLKRLAKQVRGCGRLSLCTCQSEAIYCA